MSAKIRLFFGAALICLAGVFAAWAVPIVLKAVPTALLQVEFCGFAPLYSLARALLTCTVCLASLFFACLPLRFVGKTSWGMVAAGCFLAGLLIACSMAPYQDFYQTDALDASFWHLAGLFFACTVFGGAVGQAVYSLSQGRRKAAAAFLAVGLGLATAGLFVVDAVAGVDFGHAEEAAGLLMLALDGCAVASIAMHRKREMTVRLVSEEADLSGLVVEEPKKPAEDDEAKVSS